MWFLCSSFQPSLGSNGDDVCPGLYPCGSPHPASGGGNYGPGPARAPRHYRDPDRAHGPVPGRYSYHQSLVASLRSFFTGFVFCSVLLLCLFFLLSVSFSFSFAIVLAFSLVFTLGGVVQDAGLPCLHMKWAEWLSAPEKTHNPR